MASRMNAEQVLEVMSGIGTASDTELDNDDQYTELDSDLESDDSIEVDASRGDSDSGDEERHDSSSKEVSSDSDSDGSVRSVHQSRRG